MQKGWHVIGNTELTDLTPTVFFSYSHDSPQHKEWVAEFATRLRKEGGADVILDQWDTEHGDDLVKFMEKGVRDADRVIMICTTAYVKKANDGNGGVGYETMVVTVEMVRELGTAKFIPVIPPEDAQASVPSCVSTRKFVDLRDATLASRSFDELVESLHHLPSRQKPPIGLAERFRIVDHAAENERQQTKIDSDGLSGPLDYYKKATSIIRLADYLEWQELVRKSRRYCLNKLIEFRQKQERNFNVSTWDDAREMVIEAASLFSPMIAISLAVVESGTDRFRNQTALLSDVLNPGGWVRSGRTVLVELPKALAYIGQGLIGAMRIQSRQFDLVADLARSPLVLEFRDKAAPLYAQNDIIGWVDSIGQSVTDSSRFLLSLTERWEWLKCLFGDKDDFESCVSGYYIILLTAELVALCKAAVPLEKDGYSFHVPPLFWLSQSDVARNALQTLLYEKEQVRSLWSEQGVSGEQVADAWEVYCAFWTNHSEVTSRAKIESAMGFLKNPIRRFL